MTAACLQNSKTDLQDSTNAFANENHPQRLDSSHATRKENIGTCGNFGWHHSIISTQNIWA